MEDTNKNKNGFALLSPEKRREIASKGGKSVPSEKRSFSESRTRREGRAQRRRIGEPG
jgi:general stress protein YciG